MNVGYTGGWCLAYVQNAFNTDHGWPTAISEWNDNVGGGNHPGEVPPLGITVPVWLSLGTEPAGHVAIRLDDGYVASSTQSGYHPKPYFHPNLNNLIAVYGQYNGGANYLGWSEYVGHVKVVGWEDYNNQRYSEPIAFEKATENDDTLPVGQTSIKQVGANGEHWWVDQIRTIDGAEQSRARIDEGVTAATPEITLIGTYVAPAPDPVPDPTPTDPTPTPDPETPVPAPPVSSENNILKIIARLLLQLIQKIFGKR
jgi:hypothetical protein